MRTKFAKFSAAIKASNKKSAPGIDRISTSLISSSPSNIKDMILLVFQFSLKIRPERVPFANFSSIFDFREKTEYVGEIMR